MQIFTADETSRLLDLRRLMQSLESVLREYGQGAIDSPQRLVVPCGPQGGGVLLSMPCRASDLVINKLVTVYGGNPAIGRPAIQGLVAAFAAESGTPLFMLDGPAVTARRTAAVSMLGIARLHPMPPRVVTLIGTGAQARAHVEALLDLYPGAEIRVKGTTKAKSDAFVALFEGKGRVEPHPAGPVIGDVVIAVTGSRTPVYDAPARVERLVIGVGAYRLDMIEIGGRTIGGSQVYVDDPVGAPAEAGDLAAARVNWSEVRPLAQALAEPPDFSRPIVFKSVGCAAWDLAACRVARVTLGV